MRLDVLWQVPQVEDLAVAKAEDVYLVPRQSTAPSGRLAISWRTTAAWSSSA